MKLVKVNRDRLGEKGEKGEEDHNNRMQSTRRQEPTVLASEGGLEMLEIVYKGLT